MKKYLYLVGFTLIISSCRTLNIPNGKPLDHIVLTTGDTLYGKVEYFQEKMVFSEFYKKIRLTDTRGKKRKFKRKNVLSYRIDGSDYESFLLKSQTRYFKNRTLMETKYLVDSRGVQHFLKVGEKGKLSYYELEWIDRDNNRLTSLYLVKKAADNYFIRADFGVFGVARNSLSNYLSDCPKIQEKILQKEFKYVFQVVDFYNENCGLE